MIDEEKVQWLPSCMQSLYKWASILFHGIPNNNNNNNSKNTYVHTSKHTHEQEYTHVFFAFLLSSPKLCPAKTFNNSNVRFLNCFLSLSLLLSPPGLSVYPGIGKEKTVTEKASSALYATTRIHPTRPPPRLKFSTYVSIACCTFRTGEHNSSTQS